MKRDVLIHPVAHSPAPLLAGTASIYGVNGVILFNRFDNSKPKPYSFWSSGLSVTKTFEFENMS